MTDLSDNFSSSHGQSGKTMEVVEHREDAAIPEEIHMLVEEFEAESLEMRRKIHRLPASLAGMGDQFVIPTALAIGPYHHGLPRLQAMEKVKRVAALTLIRDSGQSREEMYARVLAVADQACHLYAEGTMSEISKDKFADIMFHDACFLLQYMHFVPQIEEAMLHPSPLQRFFLSNLSCINSDIMLLENQLPWLVIEALMTATEVHVDEFIVAMGDSMGRHSIFDSGLDYINMALSGRPPHLLGLLRLHKQGVVVKPEYGLFFELSASISAIELEGMGIKLERSDTGKFSDMGISRGRFSDKLFLPPLILDRTRASWLANMVAFEVCTALDGSQNMDDNSVVCSYVAVFAMLMGQEEDVHKLRSKGLIHGELSDKQILEFFNRLAQQITPGARYFEILLGIENCKCDRRHQIKVRKFFSDNAKAIAAVLSIIGVLVGIFKALFSLKQR